MKLSGLLRVTVMAVLLAGAGLTSASPPATLPPQVANAAIVGFLPPPPPPPDFSCARQCTLQYQWCLNAGQNPSVCAGKYQYCVMTCPAPPPVIGPPR